MAPSTPPQMKSLTRCALCVVAVGRCSLMGPRRPKTRTLLNPFRKRMAPSLSNTLLKSILITAFPKAPGALLHRRRPIFYLLRVNTRAGPGSRGLTRSREPAPWRRAARSACPSSTATWPTWEPSACACWTRGPTTCTWMHFVPNITFGHPVVESLRKQLGQDPFFDMHMMVSRPEQWVKPMAVAGANQYTFHLEATENPGALIKDIRENGMKVGLAIKPGTTVEYLAPWANQIDMALVMTVEPGFGGQKFMEDMMPKVHWLRTQFPTLDIEVDGGVGPDTVQKCAEAGANMVVSGGTIMRSDDPRAVINLLRNVCSEAAQKHSLDR